MVVITQCVEKINTLESTVIYRMVGGNKPEFLCPAHAKGRKRIGFYERVIEPKILKWLSCFK